MAYTSKQSYVLIGKESTWGTSVTADKDVGLVQNLSTDLSNTARKIFCLGTAEVQAIVAGRFEAGGSLEYKVQHGRFFEYIFGSVTHDDTNAPDIKHTFAFAEDLPSFTLEDGYNSSTDTVKIFSGVKVGGARIRLELDNDLTVSADWLAKDVKPSDTASAKIVSTLPTLTSQMATVTIGGTTASEVQNVEITINRNTERIYGLGSRVAQGMSSREFSIDFSGTIGFRNKDEVERLIGGSSVGEPTEFDFVLNVDNGETAGSGKRQFYIELTDCIYNTLSKTASVGDFVYIDVAGHGKLSSCYMYDNITEANW